MCEALSCNQLILLFRVLLWYIHIKGHYANCVSINVFIRCATRANVCSFKLAFLQMLDICSLKSRWLSILTPRSLTDFSPTIVSSPTFTDTLSSWFVTSNLHLSASFVNTMREVENRELSRYTHN